MFSKVKAIQDETLIMLNQKLDRRDCSSILQQFSQIKSEILESSELQELK